MGGVRPRLLTRPPSLRSTLARPRLVAAAAGSGILAIFGPHGSGATTLAAQLAHESGRRIGWCRLATGFDTFTDVVDMAVSSVADEPVDLPRTVLGAADQLLDLFETEPLTLVIDDHHLAADGDIDRMIAELSALLPTDAQIIIAGVARPAGLIGMIPTLTLIDPSALAFTDDEAIELFALHGGTAERAAHWNAHVGGWAQGLAAGAHAPDSPPEDIVHVLIEELANRSPDDAALLDACAALPYLDTDTACALTGWPADLCTARLRDFSRLSALVDELDDVIRLTPAAATARRAMLGADAIRQIRAAAAPAFAATDPVTAIDVFLAADDPESAAETLADHLSAIGVERALTWLYRLPPELRRRFPPVLAAGQATVEVDSALAAAEARVESAQNDSSRREALFALGSVEQHRGELAAAASAFEAALRSARADDDAARRISGELAGARWLLGDIVGARAALDGSKASPSTRWLRAQLDVVDGEPGAPDDAGTEPMDLAAGALRSLANGDLGAARAQADDAYAAAAEGGGEPLLAAGVVRAWAALRTDDLDVALSAADEIERRLGPGHELGRVHGAIIRERVSRVGGDRGQHERDQRRLRDLRRRGYATIDRLAGVVVDAPTPSASTENDDLQAAVLVTVLGEHTARVGKRTIRRSEWKSKKAFEVLTVLAAYGPRGGRREQIVEAVWPGRAPDKGRTLLRTALSEIRRVIEPDRPTGEAAKHLATNEDLIALDGELDVDRAERHLAADPVAAFDVLELDLAPEVVAAEWASDWQGRVERLRVAAASQIGDDVDAPLRSRALESLISAEPWQRAHYDALIALHQSLGNEAAANELERRWFADD